MIRNTIYTSGNSRINDIINNATSTLQSLNTKLENINNALSNKNISYDEILKETQNEVSEEIAIEDMTLDEYKEYIAAKISKFGFNSTHYDDDEIIQITDLGWEKMKSDPDYESWVLDTIRKNRLTTNYLAAYGYGGQYHMMSFGANKESYRGEVWSKNFSKMSNLYDNLYGGGYSSLFGTKSKSKKTKMTDLIFSMQADRTKIYAQLNQQYNTMKQNLQQTTTLSQSNATLTTLSTSADMLLEMLTRNSKYI